MGVWVGGAVGGWDPGQGISGWGEEGTRGQGAKSRRVGMEWAGMRKGQGGVGTWGKK